jgi:hypothetical protein
LCEIEVNDFEITFKCDVVLTFVSDGFIPANTTQVAETTMLVTGKGFIMMEDKRKCNNLPHNHKHSHNHLPHSHRLVCLPVMIAILTDIVVGYPTNMCKYGADCRNKNDPVHASRWLHPGQTPPQPQTQATQSQPQTQQQPTNQPPSK